MTAHLQGKSRWLALIILCLGELMIVLDTTVVNVALPSIRDDLGFTETSLVWVVNAYLLTFGGFLLLGGRLGDLYGHRRLFLAGIVLFTLASLACGLSSSQTMLIAARAMQGLGGAVVSAVALSLIMTAVHRSRASAPRRWACSASCGGRRQRRRAAGRRCSPTRSTGTGCSWSTSRSARGVRAVPRAGAGRSRRRGERTLDVAGAMTVTLSLMLAVYAIVNGNEAGWASPQTLGLLGPAAALLALFLVIESRSRIR